MSVISIHNDQLTVAVSSMGAELQSIKDQNGVERLWQGDPAFWASRAPVLFPMAGGLKDDCYYLEGQKYDMPKHGFVRKCEWTLESHTDSAATFMITEKRPGFPFDYELRAVYTLEGASLKVDYSVRNTGDRVFWYGLGSHEAFATPEGIEAYEIEFDVPEKLDNYELDGNLLKLQPVTMAESAKTLPLKYTYFAVDALVFPHIKSRGVTLRSQKHGRTIRVDYPGFDVLMFWTKPGAGYICIEPWCNAPDYVNSDMQIEHKRGCIRLAPGQSDTRTHVITVG